jgi:transposase
MVATYTCTQWTAAERERLRHIYCVEGKSASQAAAIMGRSLGSIAGQVRSFPKRPQDRLREMARRA